MQASRSPVQRRIDHGSEWVEDALGLASRTSELELRPDPLKRQAW
jgi:hypothetical protein